MKNGIEEKKITIFTPTFNRAYILPSLYQSLVQQTNKDFTWMIIDDGSTDQTEHLAQNWLKENIVQITYIKKKNEGKTKAFNIALDLCKTELFTCVDSDDFLSSNAIELIIQNTLSFSHCVGILCFRMDYESKKPITTLKNTDCLYSSLERLYRQQGLKGDTMLIYKTQVINKYRFPIFENEKFVPENYIYDLIDKDGPLYILQEYLYYCRYLKDGYTLNMKKVIFHNPKGYDAYIRQRLKTDIKLKDKLYDSIRCVANNMILKKPLKTGLLNMFFDPIAIIGGNVYYFFVYRKLK